MQQFFTTAAVTDASSLSSSIREPAGPQGAIYGRLGKAPLPSLSYSGTVQVPSDWNKGPCLLVDQRLIMIHLQRLPTPPGSWLSQVKVSQESIPMLPFSLLHLPPLFPARNPSLLRPQGIRLGSLWIIQDILFLRPRNIISSVKCLCSNYSHILRTGVWIFLRNHLSTALLNRWKQKLYDFLSKSLVRTLESMIRTFQNSQSP